MTDRRTLLSALPILVLAGAGLAAAQEATPTPAPAEIAGFRSARFGMGESDVRAAISNDFGLGDDAVRVVPNQLDGTTILSVEVTDLIPATGLARVNYVLGYASLSLTRVNVVWGTPVNPAATAADMTKIAVLLQRYFDSLGLVPETIIRSRRLQNGTVILFAGADAAGRAVAVVYREAEVTKQDGTKQTVFLLRLSYVEKPSDPDIYRLEPGTF
jgi:hypothetical protein